MIPTAFIIFGASIIAALFFGFVAGRISTAPPSPTVFSLSTPKLAHILYEATRAYRASHGDLRHRSWNNLPVLERRAKVNSLAFFRRSPNAFTSTDPFESHLQAAIAAITN